MKLLELVDYLLVPAKLRALCQAAGISEEDIEDGEATLYMVDSLSLESEVRLFSQQEVGHFIEFQKDGVQYVYMLEVHLAAELLEGAKGSQLEKAERVLHYAIYDA